MNSQACFRALGLHADASWDEVKSAFRRLARTYHPDVAGPDGARKFAEITEAYMTLKESISPAANPDVAAEARRAAAQSEAAAQRAARAEEEKRMSIFARFWRWLRSIFSPGAADVSDGEDADGAAADTEIPPARLRFIISIIQRTENDIRSLISRRSELKSKTEHDAILSRVASKHPGVAILALRRISIRSGNDELREAILAHFKKNMPMSEVLECLLALFSGTQYAPDLAAALLAHTKKMTESDAMMLLRWYKRNRGSKECMAAMLSHPSEKVIAAALGSWPPGTDIADVQELAALLKRREESILVPLLRMLKREKLQTWITQAVQKIAAEHESQAVRVWAAAIVRERPMS